MDGTGILWSQPPTSPSLRGAGRGHQPVTCKKGQPAGFFTLPWLHHSHWQMTWERSVLNTARNPGRFAGFANLGYVLGPRPNNNQGQCERDISQLVNCPHRTENLHKSKYKWKHVTSGLFCAKMPINCSELGLQPLCSKADPRYSALSDTFGRENKDKDNHTVGMEWKKMHLSQCGLFSHYIPIIFIGFVYITSDRRTPTTHLDEHSVAFQVYNKAV